MSFQPDTSTTTARHASPHLGFVATIFTVLKLAGIISLRRSVMYLAQSALTTIPPTINTLNTIGEMASTNTTGSVSTITTRKTNSPSMSTRQKTLHRYPELQNAAGGEKRDS